MHIITIIFFKNVVQAVVISPVMKLVGY